MPRSRTARRSFGGSARRRTTWARASGSFTPSAPGYETFDLLADYGTAGGSLAGATVVRTHLLLVDAAGGNPGDVLGVGVIRGQNTDVGLNIAGAPRPIEDEFEDWAYWNSFYRSVQNVYWEHGTGTVFMLDLKSQRKIPELQMDYNLVLESTAGTDLIDWTASTLLKLP